MAEFNQAIEQTLQWEGGWVNNPADPGGATLFGIARNRHPEWDGWSRVDELKQQSLNPAGVLNADDNLKTSAIEFYRKNFWDYDCLESQAIANKVFDLGVNSGKSHAVKFLQQAAGATVDGIFGPGTCVAANACNSAVLIEKIRCMALVYYKALIAANPSLQRFWNGWSRRIEA
jgi:lysozyme family protein